MTARPPLTAFARWSPGRCRRDRVAAGRLHRARLRFERSVAVLCKAALDHVDGHDPAAVTLRAILDGVGQHGIEGG